MKNVCENLKNIGYTTEQVYQLLFLYSFSVDAYAKLIKEISPDISVEMLEQIIKCITHKTPYELFLKTRISVEAVIEIRRFLEDCLIKFPSEMCKCVILAKLMIENAWRPTVIYEFRRFLKCRLSFNSTQIAKLFDAVNTYQHWVVVACMYDIVCVTQDIESAFVFLECANIKAWLETWKAGNGDALVNLMVLKETYSHAQL